jgi:hypothetical protein
MEKNDNSHSHENNLAYAASLQVWLDSLTLTGKSGRRAVFVERSLKRQYTKAIKGAISIRSVPWSWRKGIDAFRHQALVNLTNTISNKFHLDVPVEFKFRQTMVEL